MINNEIELTSLCYISEDYDGKVWLYRLADVENERLHTPFKSDRSDNRFENRDRLYQKDGPSAIGSVGVWDWTAIPNRENPENDYVQSFYNGSYDPIRIVVLPVQSVEELVKLLKRGAFRVRPLFCNTLFCYYMPKQERMAGVLCTKDEFKFLTKHEVVLSESVCALPVYTVLKRDVFNWDDSDLRFFKEFQIGPPLKSVFIKSTDEVVRDIVLERFTWPLFRECIGAAKAEWRASKAVLEKICGESLYEVVCGKMHCTQEQARQAVEHFVKRAGALLETGDIDGDVLAQLAIHHEGLKGICEEAVSKKWNDAHAAEIAKAKSEVEGVKSAAEEETEKAKKRLVEINEAISEAEKKHNEMLAQIVARQTILEQLRAEIKKNETLGIETAEAIRRKISDAQKDMAGFIADLSPFISQGSPAQTRQSDASTWQYICAPSVSYTEDEIEMVQTWRDEYELLFDNLSSGSEVVEFCDILAAFLYAAHINHVPILIAGPDGRNIADSLAMSLYATGAGCLTVGNTCDYAIAGRVEQYNEQIVLIQNMFGKGWIDILPREFDGVSEKHIIWSHPYAEDLVVEPKGLYNYMLPILSECFVGLKKVPLVGVQPGKQAAEFRPYVHPETKTLQLSGFKKLGLSRLVRQRLEVVLTDAKAVLENPQIEKDVEFMCGLLPLCVLTGKTDVLKETIESENGLSKAAKKAAARYIEEE